ncbi:hypothetical protein KBI51_04465 [Aerococcaceae bacterium zg-ZUI334]|nr:hypothetical protein [Aerococcaceae bacterium zg-ZUI334]
MVATYDKSYTLRTYDAVFSEAKKVFQQNDLNVASAFNLFLKNVAVTGKVDLLSEEELEKEKAFKELQAVVQERISEYKSGINFVTDEELRERFGI